MQIIAYKDPVTGLLFEDESKLNEFQANRKREETAEKRRRAERDAAAKSRDTLCRELASREQFAALATKMYEFVLNSTKCKRNKSQLKVCDVRITSWAVDLSLNLRVDLEVELSGNPDATYSDTFARLSPADVLHPFSLWGCGGSRANGTKFVYAYSLSTKLEKLPKLLATMRQAAELLVAEEAHQKKVAAKAADLQKHDVALADIDQTVEATHAAYEVAHEAWSEALGQRKRRADALTEEAVRAMPFEQTTQLETLKAATGLPMAGQTDRWLALGVRNALLAKATAEA